MDRALGGLGIDDHLDVVGAVVERHLDGCTPRRRLGSGLRARRFLLRGLGSGVGGLIVRLAVVARGADAFDVADQALVAAHAAMLADPNLGGLAIAVREIDCEWEFDDADAGAATLPARYEIRYRTHAIDLTQTG